MGSHYHFGDCPQQQSTRWQEPERAGGWAVRSSWPHGGLTVSFIYDKKIVHIRNGIILAALEHILPFEQTVLARLKKSEMTVWRHHLEKCVCFFLNDIIRI